MRYFITSNLRIYQFNNSEKYVYHWEKWSFESIENFTHNAEFLALGKTLSVYIDYVLLSLTCEMKALQVQAYIQRWFHDEQETKIISS